MCALTLLQSSKCRQAKADTYRFLYANFAYLVLSPDRLRLVPPLSSSAWCSSISLSREGITGIAFWGCHKLASHPSKLHWLSSRQLERIDCSISLRGVNLLVHIKKGLSTPSFPSKGCKAYENRLRSIYFFYNP